MMASSSWIFWAILSAIFAALTTLFAKVGIQGVDSDLATLIRTAIVLLLLTLFVHFTGKWVNPFNLSKYNWLFLGLSGLATCASWVCFYRALQIGEASKVLVVDKFSIVIVAILAFIFLGEKPLPKDWLGIALVAFGLMVIAFKR
jgi:bacterial/archaeal transporter family protein